MADDDDYDDDDDDVVVDPVFLWLLWLLLHLKLLEFEMYDPEMFLQQKEVP